MNDHDTKEASALLRRTGAEIEQLLKAAIARELEASKWPGMTYEQGVLAAVRWLTDQTESNPLEDE